MLRYLIRIRLNIVKSGTSDCDEQMGIMIQEVVGCKVDYYFPLFAGVAFSNNELRWSHG